MSSIASLKVREREPLRGQVRSPSLHSLRLERSFQSSEGRKEGTGSLRAHCPPEAAAGRHQSCLDDPYSSVVASQPTQAAALVQI